MGKAPADKRPRRRADVEPKRIPGTRGSMKANELIELMKQWREEGNPEEDLLVYRELEEEARRTRGAG